MNKIIDISQHNGNINFEKVKNDGVDGVIIRVGWIGNKENHTIDNRFNEYYNKAKEVGLKIGFYVYSYCKYYNTLVSGTNWFINQVKDKECDLACFLDLEDETISDIDKRDLTVQALTFCEMVEHQLQKKAGVYASEYWFKNKLEIDKLLQYKIWLAKWVDTKPNENFRYDLWQYTSKGKINGIVGNVDVNECINCKEEHQENIKPIKESEFEVKLYQNGSTKEIVYQDLNCTKQIGYLNPYEQAECYAIINNKALVVYNVDKTNNKKTGFVKWLGGVK